MSAEKPKVRCSPAEAQRINDALDADCTHGLTVVKRDGDDMPIKAWDCYGCTASIVSDMIATALSDARREAFEEAAQAIRAECQPCGGTGGERTSHAAHAMDCDGGCRNCPVEVEDWQECEYCGRPMAAIRRRMAEGEKA